MKSRWSELEADSRGGVSFFACAALLLLILLTTLLLQVASATMARHRVAAGADLAALAAAGHADRGPAPACAAAAEISRRMRLRMSECFLRGWDASVTTTETVELWHFGARVITATARAGPISEQTAD